MTVLGESFPEFTVLSHWVSKNLTMLFYFMAGYLVSSAIITNCKEINFRGLFDILLLIVYVLRVVASYYNVEVSGLSILLSVSLFGFLMTIPMRVDNTKTSKLVQCVSRYSYGIYLSHFMLISAMLKLSLFHSIPMCIEPLLMAFTVIVVDTSLLYLIDKMKVGKFIF